MIGNTNQININAQGNLDNLYKKLKPLDELTKKYKQTREKRLTPKQETVTSKTTGFKAKKGVAKTVSHNLRTDEAIAVKVTAGGKEVKSRFEVVNDNRVKITVDEDVDGAEVTVTGKRMVNDSPARRVRCSSQPISTDLKPFWTPTPCVSSAPTLRAMIITTLKAATTTRPATELLTAI